MKTDTLRFSGAPEEYVLDKGMYHCTTCVPAVDVKTDGTDQKVTGHPYFDSIAVRILDGSSVRFTMKKGGKTTFECTETVSSDRKTMIEEFTNTSEAETVTGKAGFKRVGAGPTGAHALSGKWSMQTVSQSYEAKFDGKDYPVSGAAHATVSLRLINDSTMEETDKLDGKVMTVARMTVSMDGKSMTVESSDKQRGGMMTYTAVKRP
jgi:hypothetical protein